VYYPCASPEDFPVAEKSPSGPSDYLAAERTFLAWIRTGLALMGFGFVVARFGLFLEALQLGQVKFHVPSYGLSFWFGTALIVLGVIVNIVSALHHLHLVHELNRGETGYTRPSRLAISVALILAVVGLALAIYLVSTHEPAQPNHAITKQEAPMTANPDNGIVTIPGHHSVDETVQKVQAILAAKGVKLFVVVDHSGEAEKAGLKMNPTKLLIFGNPKAGTPLMLATPSSAIDLPLKILVWQDAQAKVWLSYNSSSYLQKRHKFPAELLQNIAVVEGLATKAAE
jgi:uncharacterized protein (DUF302 family)/uncharacterized membrane protein YidH (DUF202 family)